MTNSPTPNPWPFRLGFATWLAAIPLLLFGGTVTSLEAGMAIDGWWILEPGRGDHFLLFYPIEKWFRDMGTFSEHSHRLFGVLVGNLAIATVVVTWLKDTRKSARFIALSALLLICFQGLLGGTRVLESSPQLAFLHGALAQIVFAFLAWATVYLSPSFQRSRIERTPETTTLAQFSFVAIALAYTAIFAGAWLRHAFSHGALGVHLIFVTAATWAIFVFAGKLKRHAGDEPHRKPLRTVAKRLHMLVGMQLLLGVASFWVVVMIADNSAADVHHSAYPTLHVLFGALVLSKLAAGSLWTRRALESESYAETNAQGMAQVDSP